MMDLVVKFLKPVPDLPGRITEAVLDEIERGTFHLCQLLHFLEETIGGFGQGIEDIVITQLIVAQQMNQPGVALEVDPQITWIIDDFHRVIDGLSEITVSKIQ
jgi:hypothetical protein